MRVALLTNVLTPYRLPVYRELAATPGWSLRIFVNAISEPHWQESFAGAWERGCETLDVERVRSLRFTRRVAFHRDASFRGRSYVPWGVLPALCRFRPDVVVSSELGARTLAAAGAAALLRVPLVIWSYPSRANRSATSALRQALQRLLLARADAVVGMGRQARAVHLESGVDPAQLFDARNAPDVALYARALADLDPLAVRMALRARIGAREHVALVAGRLDAMKGTTPLLEAWRTLPAALRAGWTLLFVGDGPLEGAVRAAAGAAPAGEILHVPAVHPDRMPELYVASDLLVFPSLGDPWGLVVNEAQLCGLPVVASRLAGCTDDLVEPGRTGWDFDPEDEGDLARVLALALGSPDRERIGLRARDHAKRFTPEGMAGGLRCAVRYAAGDRRSEA